MCKLLSKYEVAELLSLSPSAFRGLRSRSPDFPRPIKITPKVLRWEKSAVLDWVNAKRESNNENQ